MLTPYPTVTGRALRDYRRAWRSVRAILGDAPAAAPAGPRPGEKWCNLCGASKPLACFYPCRVARDGRQSNCVKCRSRMNAEARRRRREARAATGEGGGGGPCP